MNDLMVLNQTTEDLVRYTAEFIARARVVDPEVDVVIGSLPQVWIEKVPGLQRAASRAGRRPVDPGVAGGGDAGGGLHPGRRDLRRRAPAAHGDAEDRGCRVDRARAAGSGQDGADARPGRAVLPTAVVTRDRLAATVTATPSATPDDGPATGAVGSPRRARRVQAIRESRRTTVTWRRGTGRHVLGRALRPTVEGPSGCATPTSASTARHCSVRSVNAAGSSTWVADHGRARLG